MKKLAVLIIALVFLVPLARTAFAAPARDVTPQIMTRLPIKGTIQSNETYVTVFPTMSVTASGTGDATQFGKFMVRYHTEMSLLDLSLIESAQWMSANGNSLTAEAVGQASENRTPNMLNLVEIYTITGGTGSFSGARGTITLNRLVGLTTGATVSTFEGYILIP
jgi:hypothetical protein